MGISRESKAQIRQRLEDGLPGYRMGRAATGEMGSWVRAVRQSVGMPAVEFTRRMGVREQEVYRIERAEQKSSLELGTLRRAAEALDCELVYALMPQRGTLGEMAAAERAARELARREALAKADERRVAEGKPRKGRDPQLAAIKELLRMAGVKS